MKRWSSAKYYREHEGRPVDQGGRVKGCFVKKQGSVDNSKWVSKQILRNLLKHSFLNEKKPSSLYLWFH